MTDTMDTSELDDILDAIFFNSNLAKQEAKVALNALISRRCAAELAKLKAEPGRFSTSAYGLWVDNEIDMAIDRLQQGNGQGKGSA